MCRADRAGGEQRRMGGIQYPKRICNQWVFPVLQSHTAHVVPARLSASEMTLPEPLDLAFEGWTPAVFAMLDRLRETPHIDQYQKEKPGVTEKLKDPFKRYRNDLVVNWVLPNRLALETEKNVFSRLLKNDFGAGGCKDNLWMAFYRPGRKRLTDAQVSHKISPDGFEVGLFVGGHAKDLLNDVKRRIQQRPERYRALVNTLLEREGWRFYFTTGSGTRKERRVFHTPLDAVPGDLERANGIWVRRRFARSTVLEWGPALVRHALEAVFGVWPVYRFYLDGPAASR